MIKSLKLVVSCCLLLANMSCWIIGNDPISYKSSYDAVTVKRADLENSILLENPKTSKTSGKIYVKDNFLIINEPQEGFHVYDNSNPENPIKIKFLKVLGSTDLSIKGNVVYANNAVDLIAITFNSDFSEMVVTKRVKNVFPELISPDGYYFNGNPNEVVINWTLKTD